MLTLKKSLLKRAIAFALTVSLVLSPAADMISGISAALAEEPVTGGMEETPAAGYAEGDIASAFMDAELSAVSQQVFSVDVSAPSLSLETASFEMPAAVEDAQAPVFMEEPVEDAAAEMPEASNPCTTSVPSWFHARKR